MLGIIDWGIGGISIYKAVRERLGAIPILYFSDTGARPYGKMSRRELADRLSQVTNGLIEKGATHIFVGCNAASTVIDELTETRVPVAGVIVPAIRCTIRLRPTRLGVIGGRRTILSGIYRRAFERAGIDVLQRIAQPLSGMIESGDTGSELLRTTARHIISPIRNCSHILLACTHYPAISDVLAESAAPNTVLIDPAAAAVETIRGWKLGEAPTSEFYTTGDPAMMKLAARNAFGVSIGRVKRVMC